MHALATTFAGWPLMQLYNQQVATDKADSGVVRGSDGASVPPQPANITNVVLRRDQERDRSI